MSSILHSYIRPFFILCLGKKPNRSGGSCGWTPLHIAAMNGHDDVVRILCERLQYTRTHEAKKMRSTRRQVCAHDCRLKSMTEKKLSLIKSRDGHGNNALHFATEAINQSQRLQCVKTLVQLGNKVRVANGCGLTPLHISCKGGGVDSASTPGTREVVAFLVEAGLTFSRRGQQHAATCGSREGDKNARYDPGLHQNDGMHPGRP